MSLLRALELLWLHNDTMRRDKGIIRKIILHQLGKESKQRLGIPWSSYCSNRLNKAKLIAVYTKDIPNDTNITIHDLSDNIPDNIWQENQNCHLSFSNSVTVNLSQNGFMDLSGPSTDDGISSFWSRSSTFYVKLALSIVIRDTSH